VVVNDLDIVGVAVSPPEADAPLIVDADAVLAGSIAPQLLQPITRRHPEILEALGGIELGELAQHDPVDDRRKPPARRPREETLGLTVGEAPDHTAA
jgi:hypothetical protein